MNKKKTMPKSCSKNECKKLRKYSKLGSKENHNPLKNNKRKGPTIMIFGSDSPADARSPAVPEVIHFKTPSKII
jgi:hypothetical protein